PSASGLPLQSVSDALAPTQKPRTSRQTRSERSTPRTAIAFVICCGKRVTDALRIDLFGCILILSTLPGRAAVRLSLCSHSAKPIAPTAQGWRRTCFLRAHFLPETIAQRATDAAEATLPYV